MSDALKGLRSLLAFHLKKLDACIRLTNLVTTRGLPVPARDGSGGFKNWVDVPWVMREVRELHKNLVQERGIPSEQMAALSPAFFDFPGNHPEVPFVSVGRYHEVHATIIVEKVVESAEEFVSLALRQESDEEAYKTLQKVAATFLSVDELNRLKAEFKKEILAVMADVRKAACEYTAKHYLPNELAKLFGMSWDKLKGKLDRGEIKHVKHTTKDYQIALSDMP